MRFNNKFKIRIYSWDNKQSVRILKDEWAPFHLYQLPISNSDWLSKFQNSWSGKIAGKNYEINDVKPLVHYYNRTKKIKNF